MVEPLPSRIGPRATGRPEAKTVSAVLRKYPELYNSRVTYHLIYTTTYLVNTEGTKIRTNRSLAAIEASLGAQTE